MRFQFITMSNKRPYNITIDDELRERIHEHGINTSRVFRNLLGQHLDMLDERDEIKQIREHQITEFDLPEIAEIESCFVGCEEE